MERNTINILDNATGKAIDLASRVVEMVPTLSQPSVIDLLAKPSGAGFTGGTGYKKSVRKQETYTPKSAGKITSGFVGASVQRIYSYNIDKKYTQDNIIASKIDYAKLSEGKGGMSIAEEVGNFILTAKESDLKELFELATTKTKAMKIFSAEDATGAPTGVQASQGGTDYATGITAIGKGTRNVVMTDLDETNTINAIRACLTYLNKLHTPTSAEPLYPHSVNGIPMNNLKILTTYENIHLIKDSATRTIIDLSNPNAMLNFTGIVAYVDTVPVIMTNQLDSDFKVVSDRIFTRDLDPQSQYLGVASQGDGRAVKLADGTVENVKPSEMTVALEHGRAFGLKMHEEIFSIKRSV